MNKKKYIVMITEGATTEVEIIENLQKIFFDKEQKSNHILISFKANIYQLWRQLKNDEFETDIIEILIERNKEIEEKFKEIDKKHISEKYLFFDYDGHDRTACTDLDGDNVIQNMLNDFNNETENGKLYISYPMVEAIKHLKANGLCSEICYVKGKKNIRYKQVVHNVINSVGGNNTRLRDYEKKIWNRVLNHGVKKANCIINNKFIKPEYQEYKKNMNQSNIFKYQLEKFIADEANIAVLSAFPFFLIDYFEEEFFSNIYDDKYVDLVGTCEWKSK